MAFPTDPSATVVPTPTSSSLVTLPSEILLDIFSHLTLTPSRYLTATSEESEKSVLYRLHISLRNVKAVCRRFATLVTPLIIAHYCDGDFYHLRLLTQRPENWEKVKTVILDGALHASRRRRLRRQTFDQFLKLRDVDAQLGLSEVWPDDGRPDGSNDSVNYDDDEERECISPLDQEEWKRRLREEHGTEDTSQSNYERAAVLCLCPNVEEVLFGSGHKERWQTPYWAPDADLTAIAPIVRAAQNQNFGRAHKFERLRYLSVDVQMMRIGDVVPVMQLPSLRHLVLEWRPRNVGGFDGSETEHALSAWGCPERSSNIETLEMRNVQCPSSIVRRLLRSCNPLRRFIVDCSVLTPDHREWYVGVFEELKEHAGTLRELVVTSSTISDYGTGASVLDASQLQAFRGLERLKVPFRLITGYGSDAYDVSCPPMPDLSRMFPASLRSLEIDIHGATPHEETTDAFVLLLRQSDSALERVHIVSHTHHDEEYALSAAAHPAPMDLPFLSTLSCCSPGINFDYTLLHHWAESTEAIEWARARILRLPKGEELLKHATCGRENRWNQLLSRSVGTPSPFQVAMRNVDYGKAQYNGYLDDGLSAEELAEELKPFETLPPGRSIPYKL